MGLDKGAQYIKRLPCYVAPRTNSFSSRSAHTDSYLHQF